ncbi:DUF2969 domain-containing protein [Streptococcus mutans]|jgi:hypothetical protein|uniref:Branched-chain amino acid aminotransferase n=1 Tax=Streptococcus mutans SM6 TaxID=857119 RepID=A0A829BL95_STRMG|nr:DUF2969 domain-containing protein [Streptococcus mutans]ARS62530.1 hypothetical protein RO10_04650 [Streptococcus mutans]AVM71375.1 DUF2969 domain-containing protein [Streptococcus mutans]AYO47587.1 DUF2969 domain-containing protein [Streptococcus mutans]EMB52164.1 hypothetical protein SMU3_09093 [Streptococcus mutans 11A1]EMB57814.1 hypothetical protein SMU88_00080 [Streptococcus mutans NLML8]
MRKKDKKIEIQISDKQVEANGTKMVGYQLTIGNKLIGEIAEIDDKFAVIKNAAVVDFHKNLETAVEAIIQTYNLNH